MGAWITEHPLLGAAILGIYSIALVSLCGCRRRPITRFYSDVFPAWSYDRELGMKHQRFEEIENNLTHIREADDDPPNNGFIYSIDKRDYLKDVGDLVSEVRRINRWPFEPIQYLQVWIEGGHDSYLFGREILVDGQGSGACVGKTLILVGRGTHRITLSGPQEYVPPEHIVHLVGTSVHQPRYVKFSEKTCTIKSKGKR